VDRRLRADGRPTSALQPELQAERFDPERAYLGAGCRNWRGYPTSGIHRPWEAPATVLATAGVELRAQLHRTRSSTFRASREAALASYGSIRVRLPQR